jgi:spore maturation protein CgeB
LPDKTIRHIHSVVDPSIESKFFDRLEFWGEVIVFAGIGLGYHITKKIKAIPSSSTLVVIEYFDELAILAKTGLFLGLSNAITFLSAAAGPDAMDSLANHINSTNRIQIVKHPASFDINKPFYSAVFARLRKDKHFFPAINSIKRGTAILLFGNHFLEEEVRGALCETGMETIVFRYNDHRFGMDFENALAQCIQQNEASFILSINMKGFDGNGVFSEITQRFNIPVFVWFVDDPRPILLHKRQFITGAMIALTWEKAYIGFLETQGFKKVRFLPLASDPALFLRSTPARPGIALGFVGSAMVDEYAGGVKGKFLWQDSLAPLAELVAEKLLADPGYSIDNNVLKLAKGLGVQLPFSDEINLTWLRTYCIHLASMIKRKRTIAGLLDFGIETFGDPEGWKRLFGPDIATHPNINYRTGLCETYRKICVNVNITSCQMPSSVNQRVFDIPLSGSFVISDNQKDLLELFDRDTELAIFETIEDLRDKARFYLTHETNRNKIVDAAQKRIKHEHLYVHRVRRIIELVEQ